MNLFKMKFYKVTAFFSEGGEEKTFTKIIEARSKWKAEDELGKYIMFDSRFRGQGAGVGGRAIDQIVANKM
ncbi:hypothetical protein AB6819_11935 [Carnobacterium maltaromaticum]|uniref:hypothetical protein n=1 Tax=Carnobacterium maltaromaticum TaxID=2751 RepID=UPI0039AEF8B2